MLVLSPPPAKKKTTPFFSDQNPGRNWKKGYDILPRHIWHMGMKCHKAMKFSDPGTWANSTVFHMWMSDIYVGFVARCSMLQECCWFNLWMGQNLLLPYAWKHAKNSWKWCLVPQLSHSLSLAHHISMTYHPCNGSPLKIAGKGEVLLETQQFLGVREILVSGKICPVMVLKKSPFQGLKKG